MATATGMSSLILQVDDGRFGGGPAAADEWAAASSGQMAHGSMLAAEAPLA